MEKVKLVDMAHSDINTSRTFLYRNTKCCDECQDSSSDDLRELCWPGYNSVQTSSSKKPPKIIEQSIVKEESRKRHAYAKYPSTAFRDLTKTCISKVEHVKECPYRRKCYQCGDLVATIRNLLDEMKTIKKTKTIALCDFCSTSVSGKCKRCEFLADRYKISETIDDSARQQRFKIWLCKVKQFLYTILERETCSQKHNPQSTATDELKRLLNELKSPLTIREPEIGYFPSIDSLENMTESKDILEQVLNRLKSDKKSEDFYKDAKCICKYFSNKKIQEKAITEEEEAPSKNSALIGIGVKEININVRTKTLEDISVKGPQKDKKKPKEEEKNTKEKKSKFKQTQDAKRSSEEVRRHLKEEKKTTKEKKELSPKAKPKSEDDILAKMLKNMPKKEKETKLAKTAPPPAMPKIDELPTPVRKLKEIVDSVSESFAECDVEDDGPFEMVKGDTIVHIGPLMGSDTGSVKPLLFKTQPKCPSLPDEPGSTDTATTSKTTVKSKNRKECSENEEAKGVIRYELSNREFIEKGWTLLPTTKIMRRMNVYKMIPANPKYDWFYRHKSQGSVLYDTGERFAEIEENGSGKWYYKSGKLALSYNCAKDSETGPRYVVYSSGENKDGGRRLPVTVLASFDDLGNGVVYDHYGNERLKYNQSEGMVLDETIGPRGKWKWHTLNDPPVLQPVFVDTVLKPRGCLEELLSHTKDDTSNRRQKEPNQDMLAIELDNFVKEKAHKILQEFKPFQIKMKALKLNDQFALKVLDQTTIYLLFREGHTSVKVNLGMQLISNEIVDTDTAEFTRVATPFDCYPPKSQSVADIQNALEKARKLGKSRGKLRN